MPKKFKIAKSLNYLRIIVKKTDMASDTVFLMSKIGYWPNYQAVALGTECSKTIHVIKYAYFNFI